MSFELKTFTETVNSVNFDMVAIEGGTFMMGSNEGDNDEKPVHSVTVSDFYMGKTEVAQSLWKAVMGNDPSAFKGDDLPVESVSWNDVLEFIRKLNQLTGKDYRLPTEAEWEYAAGGGARRSDKESSDTESNLKDFAWYGANSDNMTHPIGTKNPNVLGLHDIFGNVWEWCNDWYGDYDSSTQINPLGPASGSFRVCRGGGWYYNEQYCRASFRFSRIPDFRGTGLGFRLVLSVE
ncbi:MAG: formylglycine-generating enzyme family protein [Bacteroidota bacterium]|nr:formylglycine-generating enzyme family protein [Bacteroidota bacterium]